MKITFAEKFKNTVKIKDVKRGECIVCGTSPNVFMCTDDTTFMRLNDARLFDSSTLQGHTGWTLVEIEVVVHG